MTHEFHQTHKESFGFTAQVFIETAKKLLCRTQHGQQEPATYDTTVNWGAEVLREIARAAGASEDAANSVVENFRIQAGLAAALTVTIVGVELKRLTAAHLTEEKRVERVLDTLCQTIASAVQVDGEGIGYEKANNRLTTKSGRVLVIVPHLNAA